ncbi:MAG: DUF1549 domain-containing protein, partial [Planctomycetaceae bacterium]|nr:DUF1549 domain-containing protein [Planctomycetaceae bacterium]
MPSTAAEPSASAAVDFSRDVFPIFRRSCLECHGPEKQEGGLRLDRRDESLASVSVVPGRPDESELFRRITLPKGHDEVMPAIGDPLSPRQVATIRRWIEQGADWPEQIEVARHWSYVLPQRPSLPQVSNPNWCRNPLDYFVQQQLDEEGLAPSPRAEPEKLVRRLHLDLIGLPPTPEEVQAFVSDPTDERLAAVVDDLLNRPQFGERWARPWLDLARYADSHGFQRDNLWDIWAYRDWVIRALNADMPFDQFTIEQLAGDLLPNPTDDQLIATAFHRNTLTNNEGGTNDEEFRNVAIVDRVNTTMAVWMGTTMNCAQCHNHKYDPISQQEFFQFFAILNNTADADRRNESPLLEIYTDQQQQQRRDWEQERTQLQQQLATLTPELTQELNHWTARFQSPPNWRPLSTAA